MAPIIIAEGNAAQAGATSGVGVGKDASSSLSSVQGLDTRLQDGSGLSCMSRGTGMRGADSRNKPVVNLPLLVAPLSHRDHPHRNPQNNRIYTDTIIHTDFASSHTPGSFHIPGAHGQCGDALGLPMGDPSARRKALAIFHRLEELEVNNCQYSHLIITSYQYTHAYIKCVPYVRQIILINHVCFLSLLNGGTSTVVVLTIGCACRSVGQHALPLFPSSSRQQ